ncbi:MAG: metallophosphoesterase [Eubacterium sp.]|nr:metallophosphoesterase [Eubacterium sp.]
MRILVISDTHGSLGKAFDVWEKLRNIDLVIHCGDHKEDAETLEKLWRVPVVAVKGNCDGFGPAEEAIASTPAGEIFVTHGHGHGVDYGLEELAEAAKDRGCAIACFGHTHVPVVEYVDDVCCVNPGSLPRPKDGKNGSVAVITAEENGDFYANIVYYDTICGGGQRTRGGHLRDILNYSDGQ